MKNHNARNDNQAGSGATRRLVLSTTPLTELRLQNRAVELVQESGTAAPLLRVIDSGTHVQVQDSSFRPTLHLAELSFSLSRSQLKAALELIALGRIYDGKFPATPPDHWVQSFESSCFAVELDEISRALLLRTLGSDEWPLAWLPTSLKLTGHSTELGQWHAPAHYLLTDQRHGLIAHSCFGDIEVLSLPDAALQIERGQMKSGGFSWKSPEKRRFEALLHCGGLRAAERLLEAARAEWLWKLEQRPPEAQALAPAPVVRSIWIEKLLQRSAASGLTSAQLVQRIYELEQGRTPADWTPQELTQDLAQLSASWRLGPVRTRRLLKSLPRTQSAAEPARKLSTFLWEKETAIARDTADAAQADLDHAELLLELGFDEQAQQLLRARRASWPPLQLADLELPLGLRPSPEKAARRRLEQLAVRANSGTSGTSSARVQSLLRLHQLDPLNPNWLLKLSQTKEPPLCARAAITYRLLHGPAADCEPPPNASAPQGVRLPEPPTPLSAEDWSVLPHPLVASEQRLLSRIKTFIAKTESPDFATLKLYCERITQEDSPVTRAVDRAATLLGLGHVEIYVSRGHDDVGVRAYPHKPPFLLIGSQHLDRQSRFFMHDTQLMFAVSSELSHIRLGHVRVAPKHVLNGAIDKGKQGVDIALGVLPILKGFALANRLGMATAKLSLPQVGRAMAAARALSGAVTADRDSAQNSRADISMPNEELLLAHRLMQLSADRAGLLCCQDLGAALSAMLLCRSDYVRACTQLAELGALRAIETQRRGHQQAYDDLLVRVGALVSFYVSDAFALLSSSAYGRTKSL